MKVSFEQKPVRKVMMSTWGGEWWPPQRPDVVDDRSWPRTRMPGQLAIAIAKPWRDAVSDRPVPRIRPGSVLTT